MKSGTSISRDVHLRNIKGSCGIESRIRTRITGIIIRKQTDRTEVVFFQRKGEYLSAELMIFINVPDKYSLFCINWVKF